MSSVAVTMLVGVVAAGAQTNPVLVYTAETIPPAIVVRKGTVLEFHGKFTEFGRPQTISLQCRDQVRSSVLAENNWTVRYDAATESRDLNPISVWQGETSANKVRLIHVAVRKVDAAPCIFRKPVESENIFGPTHIEIETVSTEHLDSVDLLFDGAPIRVPVDSSGKALWTPDRLPRGVHTIGGLAHLTDGSVFTMDPVTIRIIGKIRAVPFEQGATIDLARFNGRAELKAQFAPDLHVTAVKYLIDGKPVAVKQVQPLACAEWQPSTLATGMHQFQVEVNAGDGQHILSDIYEFSIIGKVPRTQPTTETLRTAVLVEGTTDPCSTLSFSGTAIPAHIAMNGDMVLEIFGTVDGPDGTEIALVAENLKLGVFRGRGAYKVKMNSSKLAPGLHSLRLIAYLPDGRIQVLGESALTTYAAAPLHVALQPSNATVLKPVDLVIAPEPGVDVHQATFYCDNIKMTANPDNLRSVRFDSRAEQPGDYSIWAEVIGSDGCVYHTPRTVVRIPVRVAATGPAIPVAITDKAKMLTINAAIYKDVEVSTVEFELDGKTVATRNKAPFDQASIDGTYLDPGDHKLVVHVFDATGAVYTSEPHSFSATNAPLVAERKRAEQGVAESIAAVAEEKRQDARLRFRRNIAGSALAKGTVRRNGMMGTVHALSVLEIHQRNLVTGEDLLIYETGRLFTIESSIIPGTGQLSFLANAEADSQIAAASAVAFAKLKIQQLGYSPQWQLRDIVIRYAENGIRSSGPSAGVADALAFLSTALQKPVDTSVAVTGAIGLQGQVEPVGGVIFKAEAALADPAIHTLIVPAHYASAVDLRSLFYRRPELFTNKRVIYASNMEQVLRHALIGYDHVYDVADALIQTGIQEFLDENDSKALAAFRRAYEITPENDTIQAWIYAVNQAMKELSPKR